MNNKEQQLIASIDQGTSSSRVIVFSARDGSVVASHQIELNNAYPQPGWIEQDAEEMYDSVVSCLNECAEQLTRKSFLFSQVVGLGITNQRETTVVWNSKTGKPLAPAIVWSDSRTSDLVKQYVNLTPSKSPNEFQMKTGLPIHSYFSALKICWLLKNCPDVAVAARNNCLLAGTVDTWIIWRLTNGECHVTDVTNASRTLLFNLNTLKWDTQLCNFFGISPKILPKVVSSSELVGTIQDQRCKMSNLKICGILGDQQASLVAQTWSVKDQKSSGPTVKVTYGTGAFMLWNIGTSPFLSNNGILTTIAYKMGASEPVHYALEGAIAFAGATINWLRNECNMFENYDELEQLSIESYNALTDGNIDTPDHCYVVPSFSGLFCPWWQEDARAVISGLTADVHRRDILCAAIRSSAYQTYDVFRVATMAQGGGGGRRSSDGNLLASPKEIVVDGGLTGSTTLMQSLADILNVTVVRYNRSELMTALGCAIAAALAAKVEPSGLLQLRFHESHVPRDAYTFTSRLNERRRKVMLAGWHAAVERSLDWTSDVKEEQLAKDSLVHLMQTIKQRNVTKGQSKTTTMSLRESEESDAPKGFCSIIKDNWPYLSLGSLSFIGIGMVLCYAIQRSHH